MPTEIHTALTSREIRVALWALITGISGRSGAHAIICRGIKLRVGLTALKLIREAYAAKSEHGTGDDGIAWAELSPATIAARRLGAGDRAMLKDMGVSTRGGVMGKRAPTYDVLGRAKRAFLTEAQDKRWRLIFAQKKAFFQGMHGMGDAESSASAAQVAWATLKREGALTKLQALGTRAVLIGLDTGRLFASLGPGLEDPANLPLDADAPPPPAPATPEDRILRSEPGAIVVGTNVEYASRFAARRPLWPANGLPAAWNAELAAVCGAAISEAVAMVLQEAA